MLGLRPTRLRRSPFEKQRSEHPPPAPLRGLVLNPPLILSLRRGRRGGAPEEKCGVVGGKPGGLTGDVKDRREAPPVFHGRANSERNLSFESIFEMRKRMH